MVDSEPIYSPLSANLGTIWQGDYEPYSFMLITSRILFRSCSLSLFGGLLFGPCLLSGTWGYFSHLSNVRRQKPKVLQAIDLRQPISQARFINDITCKRVSWSILRPRDPPRAPGLFFSRIEWLMLPLALYLYA